MSSEIETIDPKAADLIARLGTPRPVTPDMLPEARRQHVATRLPLLAGTEPVDSVTVHPPIGDGIGVISIRPKDAGDAVLPALVYLHGGGWTYGGFETYEPLCRQLANATGRVVVFVDYRLAPENPFPVGLEDSWTGYDWVCANTTALRIESDRIGIAGDSSGGNFAAVTCLAARAGIIRKMPDVQLLIYPCVDMTGSLPSHASRGEGYMLTSEMYRWFVQNYAGSFADLKDWHLSPLFAGDLSGLPPAVILYAGFDPLRDEAVAYANRLKGHGVKVQTIYFPRQIHGFMTMGAVFPDVALGLERIASALRLLDIRN
jgi:acetyl esterase